MNIPCFLFIQREMLQTKIRPNLATLSSTELPLERYWILGQSSRKKMQPEEVFLIHKQVTVAITFFLETLL